MVVGVSSLFMGKSANAQLAEGDIIVNANYALVPSKGGWFRLLEAAEAEANSGAKFTYTGPVGLQVQYMVKDKFGVGLDGSYQSKNVLYSDDSNGEYTLSQNIIRVMVRTSWEFYNSEKFQVNWANSIGMRKADWTATGPDSDDVDFSVLEVFSSPLAWRTAIGFRYLFTENVGLSMELGLGGGNSVNAGLSYKL